MHLLRGDNKVLIRLTTDQISNFWDIIKYSVEESLPSVAKLEAGTMGEILDDLLSGTADCWVSYQRGNNNKIDGVVVTKVVIDDISRTRNLLIYSVFAYTQSVKESWLEGLVVLGKWAKSKKCYQVLGFTTEPKVVQIVNKLGGDSSTTLVKFNVDDILELGD